jgi:hypothetical protein
MAMDGRERLDRRLSVILDGGLGLAVFPKRMLRSWERLRPAEIRASASWRGGQIFLAYLLLFYIVPLAVHYFYSGAFEPLRPLLVLQIYGAFWAGWSTVTATLASDAVLRTLRRNVVPHLTDVACAEIADELARRYPQGKLLVQSWIIAAAAALVAGLAIYAPGTSLFETVWLCCGWAILFATSAKVVATATFYGIFPAYIVPALSDRLWLDPVLSELVDSVGRVGRTILLFWIGIAFSIALILLAGLNWSTVGTVHLHPEVTWFVAIEVPATGFFSIGVGVFVFLSAEAAIRGAARTLQLRTLERIDAEAGALIARIDTAGSDELKRIAELRALHASLATNGSYRGLFIGSLSVLLPFVPLLALLFK